jgi:tRNA(Arg) A34 adenosine deaminase TadA
MKPAERGKAEKGRTRGRKRPEAVEGTEGEDADRRFMAEAIRLSHKGMRGGSGGPFGALVVRRGEVIGRGHNRVLESADPTAHAEITAIRAASRRLGAFHLEGCVLYTTCEPCPMCLAAAYWARIDRIVYANTRRDAAAIGFSDAFIYEELGRAVARRSLPMKRIMGAEARAAFDEWLSKDDRTPY